MKQPALYSNRNRNLIHNIILKIIQYVFSLAIPIRSAKSDTYDMDSGDISMIASGVFSSFLYRLDSLGRYNDCGVGVFEMVISKSSFSSDAVDVVLE